MEQHKCSVCGKRIKPMAIIQDERFYHECDWCLEEVCDDHCEIDDDGKCKCQDCIEQECIDIRNGRKAKEPIGIK